MFATFWRIRIVVKGVKMIASIFDSIYFNDIIRKVNFMVDKLVKLKHSFESRSMDHFAARIQVFNQMSNRVRHFVGSSTKRKPKNRFNNFVDYLDLGLLRVNFFLSHPTSPTYMLALVVNHVLIPN